MFDIIDNSKISKLSIRLGEIDSIISSLYPIIAKYLIKLLEIPI